MKFVKQTKILIFRVGRDEILNLELGLIGFLIFLLLCYVALFLKKCQIMTGLSMEIQICSVVPARVLILGLPGECWPLTSDADLV